jgi:hypothetical protein
MSQNHMNEPRSGSRRFKRSTLVALCAILFFSGIWLAYAAYTWSQPDGNTYLPFEYNVSKATSEQDIYASLVAYGPNTASQYFPGGYALYPTTILDTPGQFLLSGGKRRISRLEILDPAIKSSETYSAAASAVDMVYVFTWKDTSGRLIESRVNGGWYRSSSGWSDVMPAILDNAKMVTSKEWINLDNPYLKDTTPISAINLPALADSAVTIRVYWADDIKLDGKSDYRDITKKFAFRAPGAEVAKFGIAPTPANFWGSDGKIAVRNLGRALYATFWVRPGIPNYSVTYHGIVSKDTSKVQFVTVDMDQIRIDSNASPSNWNTYIDTTMYGYDTGNQRLPISTDYRFINGESDTSIHRIAPYKNLVTAQAGIDDGKGFAGEKIPGLGPYTQYEIGPSGSLDFYAPVDCRGVAMSVGNIAFPTCFTDSAAGALAGIRPEFQSAYTTHPGISQHTISLGNRPHTSPKFVDFTAHNLSAPDGGNVFAFAASTFLWTVPESPPNNPKIPNPGQSCDPNDPNAICDDIPPSGVTGKTTIERDINGIPDTENEFDDDTKVTASGSLHTYKTEICNTTPETATGTYMKVNLPNKVALIGSGSIILSESTLVIDGSKLPGTATGTVIAMNNFWTDINL